MSRFDRRPPATRDAEDGDRSIHPPTRMVAPGQQVEDEAVHVTSLAGLWTTACIGRIRREAESGSVIFRQQGRRGRARATDGWARWLFRLSIVALAFGVGMYVAWARVFLWGVVSKGVKTGVSAVAAWRTGMPWLRWGPSFADMPARRRAGCGP